MADHVEQHFVAIGDQQRLHAVSSAARAATSAAGLHAQRLGAGDQIGLVRFEKAEHRGEQRRIARPRAQLGRVEPGQRRAAATRALGSPSVQTSACSASASASRFVSTRAIA